MLKLKNIAPDSAYAAEIEKIYTPSFPDNERIPFERLLPTLSSTRIMTAFFEGDLLVGMTTVFLHRDLVYLAYLVVNPVCRNKGYGSQILSLLKDIYPDRRIIIDIEQQDPLAENAEERRKRKAFYLRAGYADTGIRYFFYDVHYDLLCLGKTIKASDFSELIRTHWGKIAETAVFTQVDL